MVDLKEKVAFKNSNHTPNFGFHKVDTAAQTLGGEMKVCALLLLLFIVSMVHAARYKPQQQQQQHLRQQDNMISRSVVEELLAYEEAKRSEKTRDLQVRLQRKLISVKTHLDSITTKLQDTGRQLDENVLRVEQSVNKKMEVAQAKWYQSYSENWKWAVFLLLVLILCLAAFFAQLYSKATTGKTLFAGEESKVW